MTRSLQTRKVRPAGFKCLPVLTLFMSGKARIQSQIFLTLEHVLIQLHLLFTEFRVRAYRISIC